MEVGAVTRAAQFGQVVIGPPAAGKTSYCQAMASLLKRMGRKVAIINCDPANDSVPYDCAVNVTDLVEVSETMSLENLGPNGAIVRCMEVISTNAEWLIDKLSLYKDHYFVFDFPGQTELYTHHKFVKDLLGALDAAKIKLCAVYLVDAHHATDAGKYMSALLQTLSTMVHLELPAVNLFTKVDLIDKYQTLEMPLEFYTDVLDLEFLLNDSPFTKKYKKLNKAIADVVTNYALVSYVPVSIDDKDTLLKASKAIDKANGYVFGKNEERNLISMMSCAMGAEDEQERIGAVKDAYEGGKPDEEDELMHAYATQNPNVK